MTTPEVTLSELCQIAGHPKDVWHEVWKGTPPQSDTLTIACQKTVEAYRACVSFARLNPACCAFAHTFAENPKPFPEGLAGEEGLNLYDRYLFWERIIIKLVDQGAKTGPETVESIRQLGREKLNKKFTPATSNSDIILHVSPTGTTDPANCWFL